MANQDRQVAFGGTAYTLRFSLAAMARLEEHFGLESVDAVAARMADAERLKARDMAAILWAGMASHHPSVTLDDCFAMMDEAGLEDIGGILGGAFADAHPAAMGDEAGGEGSVDRARPRKRSPSTGSSKRAGARG